MPKATLINPITGKKVVVEAGSQEAQGYFGSGYQLMGAGGKPVEQKPPTIAAALAGIEEQKPAPAPAVPAAASASVPPKRTIADVASLAVPDFSEDPTLAALGARFRTEATQTVDEETIRAETRKRIQAQIDAINNATAAEIAARKRITQGQVGANIAQQARGGRLGSDFGTTETKTIEEYGAQAEKAIQDEGALKIASLISQADKDAAEEIRTKRAAIDQGAEKYLAYLGSQQERKQQKLSKFVQYMLGLGVDPSQLTDEQAAKIQSQYGATRDDLAALYGEAKSGKDAAAQEAAKESAALEKTKAETAKLQAEAGKKPEEKEIDAFVSDTGDRVIVLYDPNTKTTRNLVAGKERLKPDKRDTQVIESGGRKFLVDSQTGETIRDLGSAQGDIITETDAEGNVRGIDRSTGKVLWQVDAAGKPSAGQARSSEQQQYELERANRVVSIIDEVVPDVNWKTAGAIGRAQSLIPGTSAYDLNKKLESIKANIGFQELQAMRAASPTGGALGQVAVQELNFLQSVLGSLDIGQSPQQLKENLNEIKTRLENWKRAVEQAGTGEGSTGQTSSGLKFKIEETPASTNRDGTSPATGSNKPQALRNPGNLKAGGIGDTYALKDASGRPMTDEQGHLVFPSPEAGFLALRADLQAKISGNSRWVKSKDPTLKELGRAYAEDPNWPIAVASIIGVSPETRASQIDFNKLVAAVARQEGFYA